MMIVNVLTILDTKAADFVIKLVPCIFLIWNGITLTLLHNFICLRKFCAKECFSIRLFTVIADTKQGKTVFDR